MNKGKTKFNDYETALAWIKEGRNGQDRPIANNTRLILWGDQPEGRIGLRLHQTDVVTLYENGDVQFDSGGWRSMTTGDRIRYHGDFDITSDKGIWYITHRPSKQAAERRLRKKFGLPEVWTPKSEYPYESPHLGFVGARSRGYGFWLEVAELIGRKDAVKIEREFERQLDGKSYLFFDGIKFNARGKCLNALTIDQSQTKVSASNRLRKRIREYAKDATHHLHDGVALDGNDPYNGITEFDYHYCERIMDDREYPVRLFYDAVESAGYEHPHLILGRHYDEELDRTIIGGTVPGYQGSYREAAMLDNVANAIYKFVGKIMLPDREVRNAFGGMAPSIEVVK